MCIMHLNAQVWVPKLSEFVHFYNKHRIRSQDSNRKIENTSQHEHTEQLSLSLSYYPVTMQIKKF